MTRRERNPEVFEGTADAVLWHLRLETWIGRHVARGILPERFRGMSELEIYDALRCWVRYVGASGIESYLTRDDVVQTMEQHSDHSVHIVRAPRH